MSEIQSAKQRVRNFLRKLDASNPGIETEQTCHDALAREHAYHGVHPFNDLDGARAVAEAVWSPIKSAFGPIQRRFDIFLAGHNDFEERSALWVVAKGHVLGLFGDPWLGIPLTGKLVHLPFASFFRIEDGRIAETVEFLDILAIIDQAGLNPFAKVQTAAQIMSPGPRTQDGLLFEPQDASIGRATYDLSTAMLDDLVTAMRSPADHLARFWHADMNWFGPTGIGACTGFEGYRLGHTEPFESRLELVEAHYPGRCNIAEGHYSAHFWRPGLTMRPTGGYLGLPASGRQAVMHIVDIYRREGDRLAENWVFIDMLHFVRMQGVDLLADIASSASTNQPTKLAKSERD